jgi:hypothetical protein
MSRPNDQGSEPRMDVQEDGRNPKEAPNVTSRADRFEPLYQPEDDTYCWLCGGPVVKRHCRIICQVCGFMRDCSDP